MPVAKFDPVDGAALVERHRVTALLGPPALYQYLLEAVDQGHDLSSLHVGIVGTASVPTALIERIRDSLDLERIVDAYGLTEGGVVAITSEDDSVEVMSTTSGRALTDVEIRTVDDDGNDTPLGEPGEIVLRSYGSRLAAGNRPELAPRAPTATAGSAPATSAPSTPRATSRSSTSPVRNQPSASRAAAASSGWSQ